MVLLQPLVPMLCVGTPLTAAQPTHCLPWFPRGSMGNRDLTGTEALLGAHHN
jgi:hypothetical protein